MRKLNPVESAFTRMNAAYPLTLVCVLRFKAGPSRQALRKSLGQLKDTHPLLRAVIAEKDGDYLFIRDPASGPIPLDVISRAGSEHWRDAARKALNEGFDRNSGPLMRATYLASETVGGSSDLILSFHHAIMDAASLVPLLNGLLSAAGMPDRLEAGSASVFRFEKAPVLSSVLPDAFRPPRVVFMLIPFMCRQLREEIMYRISSRSVKDSPIPYSSENELQTISFTKNDTDKLIKWTRRHKVTLNNVITATMLKTVNRYKYDNRKRLLRAVQFANLRPYLSPPVTDAQAGCFATLMRSSVDISGNLDIKGVASRMDREFLKSAKKGDKFLFAQLGNTIVKKTIKAHDERLGGAALSYAGPVQMERRYGDLELDGIHAFISNNCLGAELAAFGKILFGKLSLDVNYLAAETSRDQAAAMRNDIKSKLLELIH